MRSPLGVHAVGIRQVSYPSATPLQFSFPLSQPPGRVPTLRGPQPVTAWVLTCALEMNHAKMPPFEQAIRNGLLELVHPADGKGINRMRIEKLTFIQCRDSGA